MYALEAPPPAPSTGHLSSSEASASHLEQMTSNLYNLDSASIAGYSHPSAHSPYNNSAAHGLLLPSSANYHHLNHHPLDLNSGHHGGQSMEAVEAHQRISVSSAG